MAARFVSFLKMNDTAVRPFKKFEGDAGWDLFISRSCVIQPNEVADVHTDIAIDMPPRLFARIIGRSSTMRKHGLLVNEGIIDNGYSGELFILVRNLNSEPYEVKVGERLAQVIFHPIEDIRWCEVDSIEIASGKRGNAGFGSTGD